MTSAPLVLKRMSITALTLVNLSGVATHALETADAPQEKSVSVEYSSVFEGDPNGNGKK